MEHKEADILNKMSKKKETEIMAGNETPRNNNNNNRTPNNNQDSLDKLKELAKQQELAKQPEGAPAEDKKETAPITTVTTQEFDGKEPATTPEKETATDKPLTSAKTEGVTEYVEHPSSADNDMPTIEGEFAKKPVASWLKKSGLPTAPPREYGRFIQNVKGVAVYKEVIRQNTILPGEIIPIETELNKQEATVRKQAASALSESHMGLLVFMSKHSRAVCAITDRDNSPILRMSVRKTAEDLKETGLKVAESGYGTVKMHMIVVPKRAWMTFDNPAEKDDPAIVASIIGEESPEMMFQFISHKDLTVIIGQRFATGIKPLETTFHRESAARLLTSDSGVAPAYIAAYKGKGFDKHDMTKEGLDKRKSYEEKYNKLDGVYNEQEKALALEFKVQSNTHKRLTNPLNTIPLKTQVTIPAGAAFKEREGMSAKELTDIYFNVTLRSKAGSNPVDSVVGQFVPPSDKKPFLFTADLRADGVVTSPLFHKVAQEVLVEPYHTVIVRDGESYKAVKPKTIKLKEVVKKEITEKGSVVNVSNHITTDAYNKMYFENVKVRFDSADITGVSFPTIEDIKKHAVRAKTQSGSTKAASRKLDINELCTMQIVSLITAESNSVEAYMSTKQALTALKKDDTKKVKLWSHEASAAKKSYKTAR